MTEIRRIRGRYPAYTRARLKAFGARLARTIYAATAPVARIEMSGPTERLSFADAAALPYREVALGEKPAQSGPPIGSASQSPCRPHGPVRQLIFCGTRAPKRFSGLMAAPVAASTSDATLHASPIARPAVRRSPSMSKSPAIAHLGRSKVSRSRPPAAKPIN